MSALEPRFHGEPPCCFTSGLLAETGVPHLFTTRHFPGVRPFRDSDGPFGAAALAGFAAHGLPAGDVAFLKQVHGTDVVSVARGGLAGEADVLISDKPGLTLAIFTADCLPIVIYDPLGPRLAMVHAGWRGTVQSAARAAVSALVEQGGRAGSLMAAVGPSIGPCCYEVDGPVIERLEAAFPGAWQGWAKPTAPGKWMLDLWQANEDQLIAAGLGSARIDNPRLCTCCRADLFFSYRRERGRGGRLIAVGTLPDPRPAAC